MTPFFLQKKDIDNPEGFLRIVSDQKNKEESRVPINSTARDILNRCLERGYKKIFRFNSQTDISHFFKAATRAAGFEKYRFHDLRHTFGSYLSMGQENLKVIQELMRHKSITSTLVYAKLSPDHLKNASENLNLGPMPTPPQKKG